MITILKYNNGLSIELVIFNSDELTYNLSDFVRLLK